MRARRTGSASSRGRAQGRSNSTSRPGIRRYTSAATLGAVLVALPLLLTGGAGNDPTGEATGERASARPPMSEAIDRQRLFGLDLPVAIRDGVRTIANVDGSLPAPPRLTTLFVARVPNGPQGIPVTALEAYHNAADMLAADVPGCHLDWALIASIGRIESNHARGGYVDAEGDTREPILGPVLDGSADTAKVPDTDDGRYDNNTRWDRAVGPMQFIPSTWQRYGADGNGDGVADPGNLYDATLAAGRYLCSGGLDLSDEQQLRTAVYRYNHSVNYVEEVVAWAEAYRDGVTEVPDSDVPLAAPKRGDAEPAPEPVRLASPGLSGPDTDAPDADTADAEPATGDRSARSVPDADTSTTTSTTTTPPSSSLAPSTATSSTSSSTIPPRSTTTSETTTTTTTSPATSTTTSEPEPEPTTTTPSTSTTTPTSTSERCATDDASSETSAPTSTTPTSGAESGPEAQDDTCGTETSEPSATSTSEPTP